MYRFKNFTIVILALCVYTLSAQKDPRLKLLEGEWKVIKWSFAPGATPSILGDCPIIYADDVVDTRDGSYGKMIYRLVGDSLFTKPYDKWRGYRIQKLTSDSLIFGPLSIGNLPDTFKVTYVKTHYQLDTMPTFDKIIIGNTIVSSDGRVDRIEGEANDARLETAFMSVNDYKELQNSFRKADIKNIKTEFKAACQDCPAIYITFVKDGKIYKSIETYDYTDDPSVELTTACKEFWSKVGSLTYAAADTNKTPVYFIKGAITSFNDTAYHKNILYNLSESQSALLRYYLINGKKTNVAFKTKYDVSVGEIKYCCLMIADHYYTKITKVISDGRYYKFYFGNEQPVTIDIGHNFIELNRSVLKP